MDTYELADAALTTLDIDDLELLQFDIVSEDDNTENNQVLGQIQLSEQTVNNLQVRILTDAAPEQTGWSSPTKPERWWRPSTLGLKLWAAKRCTFGT